MSRFGAPGAECRCDSRGGADLCASRPYRAVPRSLVQRLPTGNRREGYESGRVFG
jgi:hypothetical protein